MARERHIEIEARAGGQDGAGDYLTGLGQRVRDARAVRGMSRKVLARVSGISERYIAQLETGQGNVSILLLRKICSAIGVPLEDLIAEPAQDPTGWQSLRDLVKVATPRQVAAARAVLSGADPAGSTAAEGSASAGEAVQRVALIGLRGAGKSTLGRLAAERLGWPFVELNREIERSRGLSVAEIFALYGQEGYRRFEQVSLRTVATQPGPMILATGGGVVAEPLTFELLLSSFYTVWLRASPEEHMARVRQQGDLRPMADDREAMEELRTILRSREPLYGRAAVALNTSHAELEASAAELVRLIGTGREDRSPPQADRTRARAST